MSDKLIEWLTDSMTDWLPVCLTDRLTDGLADWLIDWLADKTIKYLSDRILDSQSKAHLSLLKYVFGHIGFQTSWYASFVHDSVHLYCLAVNDTISRGYEITNTSEVLMNMFNRRFQGNSFLTSLTHYIPMTSLTHYVPMTSLLITSLWHHSSLRPYDITPHYVPMKSLLIQINKLYSRIKESHRQTFMNTALRKSVMKFLENSKEPWKYYESWQSILKIILTPLGTLLSNKAI